MVIVHKTDLAPLPIYSGIIYGLVGTPGVGKSAWVMQVSYEIVKTIREKKGELLKILYFDSERRAELQAERLFSNRGVDDWREYFKFVPFIDMMKIFEYFGIEGEIKLSGKQLQISIGKYKAIPSLWNGVGVCIIDSLSNLLKMYFTGRQNLWARSIFISSITNRLLDIIEQKKKKMFAFITNHGSLSPDLTHRVNIYAETTVGYYYTVIFFMKKVGRTHVMIETVRDSLFNTQDITKAFVKLRITDKGFVK